MNREIDYVIEVAKCGSILTASEKLYITPSALSKYIQKLEQKYDIKLFDRVGKKFILTHAGKRYLYWIRRQQKLIEEMEIELSDISNSIQGTIRVGIPTGFSEFWIKKTLKRFRAQYPGIRINLVEDVSTKIVQLVSANELDFAITEIISDEPNLEYTRLYEETISIVASRDNIKLKKLAAERKGHKYPWVPLERCLQYDLVTPMPDQNITKIMNRIFADNNIHINPLITARSVSSILDCVSVNLGITITTDFAIFLTQNQGNVSIYSFGEEPITREWSIIKNKSHYLSENVKTLMDMTVHDYEILSNQIKP